jgi:uncharacterized protein (TIGR00290 family)
MKRVLLSWSSGKDSAWTLHVLRATNVEVVGLVTTFNETAGRVAMHGVRRDLVLAQAGALGLPLWSIPLPSPCSDAVYEARMMAFLEQAKEGGITHVAFGDLFLQEIRAYRERQMAACGLEPLFPVWCSAEETDELAQLMVRSGVRAVITCVDPKQLPAEFVGRCFDRRLLSQLPAAVDRCGERGEFHTFCFAGPMFPSAIPVKLGEKVVRDGFCFADVVLRP